MRKIIKDIFLYSSFQILYLSAICTYHKKNLIFLNSGTNSTDDRKPVSSC